MVVNERLDLRGTIIMWAIILLEIPTLLLLTVLYAVGQLGDDGWQVILIVFGIMLSAFTLLMNIRLILRVDSYGLAFQSPPFVNGWKKFKPEEILSIEVKKSDGLMDYGGPGVRFSRTIRAYLFYTDYIVIMQTAQKKYVFSTKKPEEIQHVIDEWKNNKL